MVAQRYLEPVFAAAGLELEVRAHAMGGQKSAPASFCTKCTYGADAHVITWDFGMTDGKETSLLSFFAKHAMEMPGRPTVLGGYRMGSKPMSRGDVFAGYARKGWPIGTFPNSCNEIVDLLPEKDVPDEGLPDWLHMLQDINKLAHRSSLDKYSDEAKAACQPKGIPGTAAWHPGYREHRLLGHLFSMPILKAFNEAFLTPSFDSLDVEAPKPAVMCRTPECAAQYECRNCLYPRSPKLGRDEWDIGSLIVQAQEPPLRERFGEAASSTWKTGCLFRGADSHNAPAPNCLGSRDGQGAIYEDVTQPETQYLLLKLPFEDAREAGYAYELSVVICEELCDWGSCEKTRERLENATLTFDGSHFVTSRQSFAWCREVTKKVDLGEDHAVLGIRNPRPGRSIKLNTVAWGLRASPLHP
uniref:Uncharacterized protein n=1 Tax=Pinguiococcus pyrenoidosus TaxID=172671 RepID=A0A7R9YB34_9STRA